MKIVKMDTNSFWKGEAGVVGLVEDQAHTFKTKLYLKNGQVKDYSCTCEKGNSYRGICAHGEALFAYYKEYQAEMSKPLVHSSSQVHTMIREYTNQEVARILEEEEGSQVKGSGSFFRCSGCRRLCGIRKRIGFPSPGKFLLSGMQGTFVFSHGTDRGTEIPEGYILKPYEPGTFF